MFETTVIMLLAAAWVVVLAPSVVRSRSKSTHTTVGGFEETMQALKRHSDGRELLVPGLPDRIVHAQAREGVAVPVRRPDPIRDRRRVMFTRLLASTVLTAVGAFAFGGVWSLPFVVSALATGGYVALLRQFKLQQLQSREVVRHLEVVPPHQSWHDEEPQYNHDAYEAYDARPEYGYEQDRYHDEGFEWREPVAVGAGIAAPADDGWHPQAGIRVRRF